MTSRSLVEQRDIVRAMLAGPAGDVAALRLTEDEAAHYRGVAAETERWLARRLARGAAPFRRLEAADPFAPVPLVVGTIALASVVACGVLLSHVKFEDEKSYPLVAASATIAAIAVAALGWAVAGWVAHRNARVQHTINLISTRFSQPVFVQHLTTFNHAFGDGPHPRVTTARIEALSRSPSEDDQKVLQSTKYILNYFEFLSSGIVHGYLDAAIVRQNLRSNMLFYYEKCLPYILDAARRNPTIMENYTRVRNCFRDR